MKSALRARASGALVAGAVLCSLVVSTGCVRGAGEPAVRSSSGDRRAGSVQRFRTRPDLRPAAVLVGRRTPAAARGLLVATPRPRTGGQAGPMLFGDDGRLLWFGRLPPGEVSVDAKVQSYRGRPVLSWGRRPADSHRGASHVIVDGSYRVVAEIRAGRGDGTDLHDLRITPRGTALVLGSRLVRRDLTASGGSRRALVLEGVVQEVSIETGRVLFDWHSLRHVGLRESNEPVRPGRVYDYFHVNSVAPDRDGNLLVSARHTSAVYKIDRRTGAILWRLGGRMSDFVLGPGANFGLQHDVQRQRDGTLTLFDNASGDHASQKVSRAVALRVDDSNRTAALVRAFRRPGRLLSTSQANMQVLPNGNVLVGWGSRPYVTEFDPSGRVVFDARFPSTGQQSYRAFRFPWVGHPTSPPDLVAEARRGGGTTLYASWNGATEVARWEALAGARPEALDAIGDAPRRGFETVLAIDGRPAYVAVRALDRSGESLGTSRVIQPSRR